MVISKLAIPSRPKRDSTIILKVNGEIKAFLDKHKQANNYSYGDVIEAYYNSIKDKK